MGYYLGNKIWSAKVPSALLPYSEAAPSRSARGTDDAIFSADRKPGRDNKDHEYS